MIPYPMIYSKHTDPGEFTIMMESLTFYVPYSRFYLVHGAPGYHCSLAQWLMLVSKELYNSQMEGEGLAYPEHFISYSYVFKKYRLCFFVLSHIAHGYILSNVGQPCPTFDNMYPWAMRLMAPLIKHLNQGDFHWRSTCLHTIAIMMCMCTLDNIGYLKKPSEPYTASQIERAFTTLISRLHKNVLSFLRKWYVRGLCFFRDSWSGVDFTIMELNRIPLYFCKSVLRSMVLKCCKWWLWAWLLI